MRFDHSRGLPYYGRGSRILREQTVREPYHGGGGGYDPVASPVYRPGTQTASLRIEGPDGKPLEGAIVNEGVFYDGTKPVSLSHEPYEDEVKVRVRHFGRVVFNGTVKVSGTEDGEDVTNEDGEVVVKCDAAYYPADTFVGAEKADWVGGRVAAVWRPPRKSDQAIEYEISIAKSEEHLFTKGEALGAAGEESWTGSEAEEVVSYTKTVTGQHATVQPNPSITTDPFVLAVRRKDGTAGEQSVLEVQERPSSAYESGSEIGSVSVDPSVLEGIAGDVWLLSADVTGAGSYDPTVQWNGSEDVEVLRAGPKRAIVRTNGDGTLSVAAAGDNTITTTVSASVAGSYEEDLPRPEAPTGLESQPVSADTGTLVRWSPAQNAAATLVDTGTRAFVARASQAVIQADVDSLDADLYHLSPTGQRSEESTSISATLPNADTANARPAVQVQRMLPEVQLASNGTAQIDLSEYAMPVRGLSWADMTMEAVVAGERSISVSRAVENGSPTATVQMEPGSDWTGFDSLHVVMLRFSGSGNTRAEWFAFPVRPSGTSGLNHDAASISGASLALAGLLDPPAESLVGSGAEVVSLSQWQPALPDNTTGASARIEDGTVELSVDPMRTLDPGVVVLDGEDGASVLCLVDDGKPYRSPPKLPLGPGPVRAEFEGSGDGDDPMVDGGWTDSVPISDLFTDDVPTGRIVRILNGNQLHDVYPDRPPEPVYYQPPLYVGDSWLNEDEYPSDANIKYEEGLVQYRSGLKTDPEDEAVLNLNRFDLTPQPRSLSIKWSGTVAATGNPIETSIGIEITYPDGTTSTVSGISGETIALDELEAGKKHTVTVLGVSKDAYPERPRRDVAVTAWRQSDMSYRYVYNTEADEVEVFTDAFGTEHESPSFPLEVENDKAVREHPVTITWPEDEQNSRPAAEFQLPPEPVSFEDKQTVGHDLPADQITPPTFYRAVYGGENEITVAEDVFQPARHLLEPVGYLPPTVSGELQDHVDVWFESPSGENLGAEVQATSPSELRVRLRITATDSKTPVVFGIRALKWQIQDQQ